MTVGVSLCAGTLAVELHQLCRLGPLTGFMGSKRRWAGELGAAVYGDAKPERLIVVDAGPWGDVWETLANPAQRARVVERLLKLDAQGTLKDLWPELVAEAPSEDAARRVPERQEEMSNPNTQEGLVPETPTTDLRHGISNVDVVTIGPFRRLSIHLHPGVNVILGDNGTGKTWLLKLMYAAIKRDPWLGLDVDHATVMAVRLKQLFLPASRALGRIVRHGSTTGRGCVLVSSYQRDNVAVVRVSLNHEVQADHNTMHDDAVLIPSGDVLAIYEGFRPLYAERAISVDATYADACAAVGLPALRSPGDARMKLIAVLEAALGGSMSLGADRFYLKLHNGKGDVEAHLMSEGHRKVGLLALLIANGSVGPGRTLFWDQPDASIGPCLLLVVAEVLRGLAELGAQIIVTTHSPVMLAALAPQKIVRLVPDEAGGDGAGGVVQAPEGYPVALMTTTALLSEYWGLSEIDPLDLGGAALRLGYLIGDPGRSPKEDAEIAELRAKLAAHGLDPDWEPVPIDPTLQRQDAP